MAFDPVEGWRRVGVDAFYVIFWAFYGEVDVFIIMAI